MPEIVPSDDRPASLARQTAEGVTDRPSIAAGSARVSSRDNGRTGSMTFSTGFVHARATCLAWVARNEWTLIGLVLVAVLARFIHLYVQYPMVPTSPDFGSGWYNWTDQSRYFRSSLAWAHLDFDASQHWYLPAYPLIGALFVALHPADPYLIPNLLCFLLTAWLMTRLARFIMPDMPMAGLIGALAFMATSGLRFISVKAWIEPWTTTLLAPLLYGLLLATLRFAARPNVRYAVLCGVIWGAIAMTRPTEATWTALPSVVLCTVSLFLSAADRRTKLAAALAGTLSAAGMLALLFAIHLTIYGWAPGRYISDSLLTGFEWRLIPIRWVTLILDPAPTHEMAGPGLAFQFWWIMPGFAGMLGAMIAGAKRPSASLLVGATLIVHYAVYLSYRDLHPEGLWRFGNYHYFKWTQPILGFYAVVFCWMIFRGPRWAALLGALVVAFACCWRVSFYPAPDTAGDVRFVDSHRIAIASGLSSPDLALLLEASGSFDAIYSGQQRIEEGGRIWYENNDVKAWPLPHGLALSPLRVIPPGEGYVLLDSGITVAPDAVPQIVRQVLTFGVPWRHSRLAVRPPG